MKTILIVDDNTTMAELLAEVLEGRYKTHTAETYNRAIEQYEQTGADLVITDYDLPEKNGYELVKELQKRGYNGQSILITGNGKGADEGNTIFARVLKKPFTLSDFEESVNTTLENSNNNL